MNAICISFFISLGSYLSTFKTSPPHSFLNDSTISLENKIAAMSNAVSQKSVIDFATFKNNS